MRITSEAASISPAPRWLLWTILASALLLRCFIAFVTSYVWDEDREWIYLAERISLDPSHLYLPLRGIIHPILPAYLIKLSGALFGDSAIGFRLLDVVAGVATILVIYDAAKRAMGQSAALWAAALLAFNEYHIGVSALAVQKSFYLLFTALALRQYLRFVQGGAPRALYATAVFLGFSFLCYEIAILGAVAIFIDLLLSERRKWLRSRATYLALGLFLIVASPDIYWNLRQTITTGAMYNYADHISRVQGISLSYQPLAFFARAAVRRVVELGGGRFFDPMPEYRAMNPLTGAVLVLSVLVLTLRPAHRSRTTVRPLVVLFWTVCLFFALVQTSSSRRVEMDPTSWLWCDLAILPAVILAGTLIASLGGARRAVVRAIVTVGLLVAVCDAAVLQLKLPAAVVYCDPEYISPSSAPPRTVTARVQVAVACGRVMSAEIEGMNAMLDDGSVHPAMPGTDFTLIRADRDALVFALNFGGGGSTSSPKRYEMRLSIQDTSGHRHNTAAVVHVADRPAWWRPPFWAAYTLDAR